MVSPNSPPNLILTSDQIKPQKKNQEKEVMKLPFLSRNNSAYSSLKSRWPWPSCHQPRTLSFRNITTSYDADTNTDDGEWPSFSGEGHCSIETLIRSVKSERLLFKPAGETKSIVDSVSPRAPFEKSVILSMESDDPFGDFKKSMEEMVETQGLKDWNDLEELLTWYLNVNGKSNHGYIVGAFVDLLVGTAFAAAGDDSSSVPPLSDDHLKASSPTTCSCCCYGSVSQRPAVAYVSPSSPLSFYTYSNSSEECDDSCCVSPCISPPEKVVEEIVPEVDEEEDATSASSSSSPF